MKAVHIRMNKSAVTARVHIVQNKVHEALEQELLIIAQQIMEESRQEVPVETGAILDSAIVLSSDGKEIVSNTDRDGYSGNSIRAGSRVSVKIGYNLKGNAKQPLRIYDTKKGMHVRMTASQVKDYIWRVHEDVLAHHDQGKAKFLEDPVNRHRHHIKKRLDKAAAKVTGELNE